VPACWTLHHHPRAVKGLLREPSPSPAVLSRGRSSETHLHHRS
jgi:hypothetical protein